MVRSDLWYPTGVAIEQQLNETHRTDDQGNPRGGWTEGVGLSIDWQDGPLVDPVTGDRRDPNGAFVETVIRAAIGRLEHYQSLRFACEENAEAIRHLDAALAALASRTARREAQGVEGTHGNAEGDRG